jgi:hypothetical protein
MTEKFSKKKLDTKNSGQYNEILKDANGIVESCRVIVGNHEMCLNAGLWRKYARENPDALRYAIHRWWALDPIRRRSIKHPPAWLITIFQQAERAFALKRKSK